MKLKCEELMIRKNAKNKIEGRKNHKFSIVESVSRLTKWTKLQSVLL
jgi:hypothetical protein